MKKLLLLIALVCAASAFASGAKRITVSFRFDDYPAMHEMESGTRILNAFMAKQIPITFAVIPYDGKYVPRSAPGTLDAETRKVASLFVNAIKSRRFEVAQHGYSHEENYLGPDNGSSEFAHLLLQDQVDRMRTGKALLEKMLGRRVKCFVPPWSTYDINTLRAAAQCGFRVFSASGLPGQDGRGSSLKFRGSDEQLSTLKQRIDAARKETEKRPVVTVLFHAHDFTEINEKLGTMTFPKLDELLDWVKTQPDVRVKLLSKTAVRVR